MVESPFELPLGGVDALERVVRLDAVPKLLVRLEGGKREERVAPDDVEVRLELLDAIRRGGDLLDLRARRVL